MSVYKNLLTNVNYWSIQTLRMSCECDTTVFKVELLKETFFPHSVFTCWFFFSCCVCMWKDGMFTTPKTLQHPDRARPPLAGGPTSSHPVRFCLTRRVSRTRVRRWVPPTCSCDCMSCFTGVELHDEPWNEYLGSCLSVWECLFVCSSISSFVNFLSGSMTEDQRPIGRSVGWLKSQGAGWFSNI